MISARPLSNDERSEVEGILRPGEPALFFAQSHADQRHGLEACRAVAGTREDKRAALLHDTGKRHARLGAIGRVLATVLAALRVPLRGRFAQYADHGELAWRELVEIGETDLVLGYVRHHHARKPDGYPPDKWSMLLEADSARIRDR